MKKIMGIWLTAFAPLVMGLDVSPLATRQEMIDILTNSDGMTVYVFDKDTNGNSVCEGPCAKVWPHVPAGTEPVNAPLGIITRSDGSSQLTFNGRPLYTYEKDMKPGDMLGDRVFNVWHLVHP